ncbi:super-infection exclusion protein B [Vibrio anguillarum]|uniref:super-infection exclusion protein B n=1 Tax=Vibrio anguillarum TaxID=55601 RepID=UPI00188CBA49|nr:super-infection exclusion protein B [Vibrio anguillarum]
MDISTITSALRLPKKTYFLGAFVSGMLLFLNDEMLQQLGLLSFKELYSMWIGIFFLITFGMSVIFLGESVFIYVKQSRDFRQKQVERKLEEERIAAEVAQQEEDKKKEEVKENERYQRILERLDNYEKSVLREFFISQKNTEEFCFDDATVMGLIKKGVIKQVSNHAYQTDITGRVGKFRIDDRAIDYLNEVDFDAINHVARPEWVERIEIYKTIQSKALEIGRQIKHL